MSQIVINGDNIELLKESLLNTYLITNDGIVINKLKNKEVKFTKDHRGYLKARLHSELSKNKDGRIPIRLHRLVAMFHLKNFDSKLQVNHKDGVKENNKIDNLEMVTNAQNQQHAWDFLDKDNNRRSALKRNNLGRFIKRKN